MYPNPYDQNSGTNPPSNPYEHNPYTPSPPSNPGMDSFPPAVPAGPSSPSHPGITPNPGQYPSSPQQGAGPNQHASTPPPGTGQQFPYYGNVPAGPPPQKRSTAGRVALILLVALVVLVGVVAAIAVPAYNTNISNSNATATAQSAATAGAKVTATAQVNATATAVAGNYPFSANVKLDDPLADNSKGSDWRIDSNCTFKDGSYHITNPTNNTYYPCVANKTDLANFTYQIAMKINKGKYAGVTFRGNDAQNKFYALILGTNGSYTLFLYTGSGKPKTLDEGTISNFNRDEGQSNTIGVVARDSKIEFYLDQQRFAIMNDTTYNRGQIGTICFNLGSVPEVEYSQVKVWEL